VGSNAPGTVVYLWLMVSSRANLTIEFVGPAFSSIATVTARCVGLVVGSNVTGT